MLMSSADPAPLSCGVTSSSLRDCKLANYHVIRKGDLQRFIKLILTSSVDEAGSRMIRANLCRLRSHSLQKQTLILCVFSSSDVRSKWRLLCSLLQQTPQSLNQSHSCLHLLRSLNNGGWWQINQGGAKVKRQCQSTIVGGAWVCVTSHC